MHYNIRLRKFITGILENEFDKLRKMFAGAYFIFMENITEKHIPPTRNLIHVIIVQSVTIC